MEVDVSGVATRIGSEYREVEAILFSLIRDRTFATDTLIVVDGLLRSPVFADDLFRRILED